MMSCSDVIQSIKLSVRFYKLPEPFSTEATRYLEHVNLQTSEHFNFIHIAEMGIELGQRNADGCWPTRSRTLDMGKNQANTKMKEKIYLFAGDQIVFPISLF